MGSNDKIILLRCPQNVYLAVQEAIHVTSKFKVQCETSFTYHDEEVIEIKMTGEPWVALEDEFTPSRRLLVEITQRIEFLNWKFLGAANLKGSTDTLFFLQNNLESEGKEQFPSLTPPVTPPVPQPTNSNISKRGNRHNTHIALVSLNGHDRLRLVEFRDPEIVPIISWTLSHLYDSSNFKPIIGDYFGATEFVLPDKPFNCDDSNASSILTSRTMICAILSALNSKGWEVLTTFESAAPSTNLSVLLMSRCVPRVYPYSCISMTGHNQINFIAFRPNDCETLRMIAHQAYAPGIQVEEEQLDNSEMDDTTQSKNLYLILKGEPWTEKSAYSCHGKSMLLLLLVKAEILGWRLIASINVSCKTIKDKKNCSSNDIPADVDSWFFRYVGESQRPFRHQDCTNSDIPNDCNGIISKPQSYSSYFTHATDDSNLRGISTYPPNDSLKGISGEFRQLTPSSQPIQVGSNSVQHMHMQQPEYSFMHTPTEALGYHNGFPKTISSCPNSFRMQEEKLLTTLV